MPRKTDYSALIDGILKIIALGGITATVLVAPNAIQLFDKPLAQFNRRLTKREKERELRRAFRYLKSRHLITEHYEHGLALTDKAKGRLAQLEFNEIQITPQQPWDKKWRILFFDIPEAKKSYRDAFAGKLRSIGFEVLQRSVFVHPFPCREQVEQIASHYQVEKYVSYIEADYIDNQKALAARFTQILS